MLRTFNRHKGQSTVEYAVLTAIIIGALLTIQTYVKRGVQGRLKSSSDDIGDQFSPNNTNAIKTTSVKTSTREMFGLDDEGAAHQGMSISRIMGNEVTNTVDRSQIVNVDKENWGTDTNGSGG